MATKINIVTYTVTMVTINNIELMFGVNKTPENNESAILSSPNMLHTSGLDVVWCTIPYHWPTNEPHPTFSYFHK